MPQLGSFILQHKLAFGLALIVLGGGGYAVVRAAKPTEPTQYVLATPQRQTILTSVAASGQVSGENQVDLKPTVSGALTKVLVKAGDTVTTSTPIALIDPKEGQKTVRDAAQAVNDARISLQSAQITLQKLREPTETGTLTQAQNTVNQAQRALDVLRAGPDATDVLQAQQEFEAQNQKIQLSSDGKTPNMTRDVYDSVVPTLRSASQSVQTALRDLDQMIQIVGQTNINGSYEYSRLVSAMNPNNTGGNLYQGVQQAGTTLKTQVDVLRVSNEDAAKIDAALSVAQTALDLLSPLLQQADAFTQNLVPSTGLTQSTIDSLRSSVRSDRADVLAKTSSITNAIKSLNEAKISLQAQRLNVDKARTALEKVQRGAEPNEIATAQERLTEAKNALTKLQQGATALDIASAQNGIEQRRSALATAVARLIDAQDALKDYTIHAPFDGVMATVAVHAGDEVSPSTVIGTLLTKAKIASISLNEVDVSKIKHGQKATLTFDAVPDLQIAGSVTQIDTLATVSQGVVNYAVKVAFLTEDDRVKPGMSVSLSIITDVHADVLTVPNAALQQLNGQVTVRVLNGPTTAPASPAAAQAVIATNPPETRVVEVGLANDTVTEILTGLQETDQVVTRVIDPAAVAATRATPSAATTNRLTGGLGGALGGVTAAPTGGGFRGVTGGR